MSSRLLLPPRDVVGWFLLTPSSLRVDRNKSKIQKKQTKLNQTKKQTDRPTEERGERKLKRKKWRRREEKRRDWDLLEEPKLYSARVPVVARRFPTNPTTSVPLLFFPSCLPAIHRRCTVGSIFFHFFYFILFPSLRFFSFSSGWVR